MGLLPPDFESGAYTNFATPAVETLNIRADLGGVKQCRRLLGGTRNQLSAGLDDQPHSL